MSTNNYVENEVVSVKESRGYKSKYPIYQFVSGSGNVPIPVNEYVTSEAIAAAGFAAAVPLYTFPNDGTTWQVLGASVRFTTAGGTSATAQVELAASGTAPGSGTNQLSAGMSLTGSANTAVNGTLIATPTVAAAGASLNLVPGGTMAGLVGMVVTIVLLRLS